LINRPKINRLIQLIGLILRNFTELNGLTLNPD